MIKHLFICSCHSHVFVVSCRRRSSTSSKSSSRAWPNCGRPWWTHPSTCFSSKWRLNWNRLKTNWSRPKMNWVPGNLHLIGKDNQNNPPQKNKTKQKSQDFLTPPTLTLTADMQEQWWGGRLTKCCTHHEIQTLQKASHSQKNPNKPQTVFVLLHCASYISHNLKRKDSMVRWHLCFSSLPSSSPHRPRAWRSPDCSWRGGHSLPDVDMASLPPPLKPDSSLIK